ncbi:hypothetical protein U9M48_021587 [Paspalum notatum var. saurae]|uniref:Uncharacterized protein n=1 Tax=Paspalum notatum var. saurae TaxID=547442 RepID=A0AAQ3TFY6_PASNO
MVCFVLSDIPVYLLITMNVIKAIGKIRRAFLWKGRKEAWSPGYSNPTSGSGDVPYLCGHSSWIRDQHLVLDRSMVAWSVFARPCAREWWLKLLTTAIELVISVGRYLMTVWYNTSRIWIFLEKRTSCFGNMRQAVGSVPSQLIKLFPLDQSPLNHGKRL